MKMLNY